MPVVKIDSLEQMVETYIMDTIRSNHPNLDPTPGSVLYDTSISPIMSIINPLIKVVNESELSMDLINAPYMSEDQLDKVGVNNYFMSRNMGSKATGVASFKVTEILPGNDLIIPTGILISTVSGVRFRTATDTRISSSTGFTYYNTATFMYEIPVPIEALEIGINGNVEAAQIVKIDTPFNANVTGVTNLVATTGGEDKESNASYVQRIKAFYTNNFVGTKPGYKNLVLNNFAEVLDVSIVGFRDRFMYRDLGQFTMPDGTLYQGHIGGKVDIYVQGENAVEQNIYSTVTNGRKKLNYYWIMSNSSWGNVKTIVVKESDREKFLANPNDSSVTKILHTLHEDTDLKGEKFNYVEVAESTIASAKLEGVELVVLYIYKLDEHAADTDTFLDAISFTPREMKYTLPVAPVDNAMLTLTNQNLATAYDVYNHPDDYYTKLVTIPSAPVMDKLTYAGTKLEQIDITLKRENLGFNGDTIDHKYTVNATLVGIDNLINVAENRIITTDVLIRPAQIKLVNIKIRVRPQEGYVLNDELNDLIFKAINTYISNLRLGESLDESDLISELYAGPNNVRSYVEWIELPFKSFYPVEEKDATKPIIDDLRADFLKTNEGYDTPNLGHENIPITASEIQYIKLNKLDLEEVVI